MNFRRIVIEKDKDMMIKFRKDAHVISFGSEEGFDEIAYLNRIKERVKNFPDGQVIIEGEHQPIGQIGLYITEYGDTKIGYVNLFYLISEYRGKGFGKKLVDYAEKYFRQMNVAEYHLRVSPSNHTAIHFYFKSGMVKLREENEKFPLWRMRKQL